MANVISRATPEVDVANRAINAYSGMVNPKHGIEAMRDESEGFVFYQDEGFEEEAEEEEEEDKGLWEWDEWDDEEEGEDDSYLDLVTSKTHHGVFLDRYT
jgi:hypothetical protein